MKFMKEKNIYINLHGLAALDGFKSFLKTGNCRAVFPERVIRTVRI
jgi:hypothetical protein